MNLRTLLLAVSFAAVSCSISVPPQFSCPTPGDTAGCGTKEICGPDLLCTAVVDCKTNEARCKGVCVDVVSNRENCGACSTTPDPHACGPSQQCVSGHCTDFCAAGQTACQQSTGGFICENLSNDRTNCGTCGNVCAQGKVCTPPTAGAPGQCSTECVPGLSNCSGNCLDLNTDDASCGACGNACSTGTHCVGGHCSVICTPGTTECPAGSGKCVDTTSDRANCGGCAGSGGQVCQAGFICGNSSCQLSCQGGLVNCGGTCINPQADRGFCGAKLDCQGGNSGAVCGAGEVCTNHGAGGTGVCELQCPAGQTSCTYPAWGGATAYFAGNQVSNGGSLYQCTSAGTSAASGGPAGNGTAIADGTATWKFVSAAAAGASQCVNLQADRNNCGFCDDSGNTKSCASGDVCVGGACVVSCAAGLTECNGTCVDTGNDPANCGACGASCSASGSAGPVCGNGTCGVACPAGQTKCSGKCVDTATDSNHCGADASTCAGGTVCSAGQVCQNGGCTLKCPAGSVACGTKCIDPLHDNANCGADTNCQGGVSCPTGTACTSVGGVGQCTASCGGFTDCGGICKDTGSDPANCKGCGIVCGPTGAASPGYPNGTSGTLSPAFCAASGCGVSCTSPYADCNNDLTDGCEVNLSNGDPSHCGSCLHACAGADNAGPTCASSNCGIACGTGFGNCDNDAANGCESDSAHDAANCGAACGGTVCGGATPFCNAGCTGTATGVQQNVQRAAVEAAGQWGAPCYTESYAQSGTTLAQIQTACPSGTQVMIACAAPGSSTLVVAATAPRAAAFSGGAGAGATFYVPGAGVPAWGFTPTGVSPSFTGFDVGGSAADGYAGGLGSSRLSWPMQIGQLAAGGRCGDRTGTSATSNYLRLVYTK